jgi:hypothetical protein
MLPIYDPNKKTEMSQWLKLKNKFPAFTMRLTLIFDLLADSGSVHGNFLCHNATIMVNDASLKVLPARRASDTVSQFSGTTPICRRSEVACKRMA